MVVIFRLFWLSVVVSVSVSAGFISSGVFMDTCATVLLIAGFLIVNHTAVPMFTVFGTVTIFRNHDLFLIYFADQVEYLCIIR